MGVGESLYSPLNKPPVNAPRFPGGHHEGGDKG
jgi:hypothetical protein